MLLLLENDVSVSVLKLNKLNLFNLHRCAAQKRGPPFLPFTGAGIRISTRCLHWHCLAPRASRDASTYTTKARVSRYMYSSIPASKT
jgi:hypothetical protein